MSLDESEGNFMATSSITANFYTDDPKAANKIVHALFTDVKPSFQPVRSVRVVGFKSEAQSGRSSRRLIKGQWNALKRKYCNTPGIRRGYGSAKAL